MKRLCLFILLLCGILSAQVPTAPNGYIQPVAFTAQQANGKWAFLGVDVSGNIFTSGSPALIQGPNGFVTPFAPVGYDTFGVPHFLGVDASGNLKISGGTTTFAGVPSGTCTSSQTAVNTLTGDLYSCNSGVWLKVGPGAAGSAQWNTLVSPAGATSLTMAAFTTLFTYNAATGAGVDLYKLVDTASNTGTGHILLVSTATSSAAKPIRFDANGNGVEMSTLGVLAAIGSGHINADQCNGAACGTITSIGVTAPVTTTGGATPTIAITTHGGTARVQLSDNSGTSGNIAKFAANGDIMDGGIAASGIAPLANPTFTGTVTMPAPTFNNVTGIAAQCLQANTSGVMSGTGIPCGSGGGASNFSALTDFQLLRTSATVLTINGSASSSTPAVVRFGDTATRFTASCTITISAGQNLTEFVYITSAGTITFGNNGLTTVVSGSGCAKVDTGITAFPLDAVPLYQWTTTSVAGQFDSAGGTDFRSSLELKQVVATVGIAVTPSSGKSTIGIDTAVVPLKTDNLSVFAATTSAQFLGVISDEIGSGSKVVSGTTVSGNGTISVTSTGAQTSGNCVKIDANGNHIDSGSPCGGAGAYSPRYWAPWGMFYPGDQEGLTGTQDIPRFWLFIPSATVTVTKLSFVVETGSGTACSGGTCGMKISIWDAACTTKLVETASLTSGGSPDLNTTGTKTVSITSTTLNQGTSYYLAAITDSTALVLDFMTGVGTDASLAAMGGSGVWGFSSNSGTGNGGSIAFNASGCGTITTEKLPLNVWLGN